MESSGISGGGAINLSGLWASVVLPEQKWPSWPEWVLRIDQNGSILEGWAEYYGQYQLQSDFSYVLSGAVNGTAVYIELDCSNLVDIYDYFVLSWKDDALVGEHLDSAGDTSRVLFIPSQRVKEEWVISRSPLRPKHGKTEQRS
jgi:hypothetical protein